MPPGLDLARRARRRSPPRPPRPGSQASDDGGARARAAQALPAGRPDDEHEHDRRAGREHGADELLLDAGEVERRPVAALAARAVVRQARLVAHHQDGDVRPRLPAATASSKPSRGEPLHVATARERDPRAEPLAHRVEDRAGRDLGRSTSPSASNDAESGLAAALQHVAERLDVGGVAVVAEAGCGRCPRSGRSRRPSRGSGRAGARRRSSSSTMLLRAIVRASSRWASRVGRRSAACVDVDVRLVEQAEARTSTRSTRRDGLSSVSSPTRPDSSASSERLAVAVGAGSSTSSPALSAIAAACSTRRRRAGGSRPAGGSRSSRRRRSRRTPTRRGGSPVSSSRSAAQRTPSISL